MAADIKFGVLAFQALPFAPLLDDARHLEGIGLDAIWLADQAIPPQLPILEAWTTLAALAAGTERIRLGTLVTNVAMRNPMLLARQALTVDQVSGGRLDLGIGAGYYEDDHRWLGIDYLDGRGRVQRLKEAAEILDHALRGERVTYAGEHFRLEDAPAIPAPVQLPRPPLWIAAHARGSMRLAVSLGQGLASFGDAGLTAAETLVVFRERMARVDELCAEAGRDPGTLRRAYLQGFADEPIFTSRAAAEDFIGRFVEAGVTDFVLAFFDPVQEALAGGHAAGRFGDRGQLEAFLNDVAPRYRVPATAANL